MPRCRLHIHSKLALSPNVFICFLGSSPPFDPNRINIFSIDDQQIDIRFFKIQIMIQIRI